jgi:hypothetical protein
MDLDRIAYFFGYEFDDALPETAYSALRKAVGEWSQAWKSGSPPVLAYRSSPGFLLIYDGRHDGRAGTYAFHDTLADIYLACTERPTTAPAVHAKLELALPVTAVEDAFRQFHERGLMFLDGNLALSLALPATPGR